MSFTPWDFFVLDQVTKEQNIDTAARHLADNYSGDVDYDEFCEACRECNVDPNDFEQNDITAIQHKLNFL